MDLYKNFRPKVSIILPTYNRANLLPRSIESVLKQSFADWELLIIDDGSTDLTFEVVNKYSCSHSNIRYLKHKNRKVTLTMNAGILASCGEYITFLGSDDEYTVEHIKKRIEFFENNNVDIIYGGAKIIGEQFVYDKNDLTKKIHLSECVLGGTLFGKREAFLKIDGFNNLEYSGESDLVERAEKFYTIAKVDFPTYIYYRDTRDSICNNIRNKKCF